MNGNGLAQALQDLERALATTPVEELPVFMGHLKRLEVLALARLMQRPEPDNGNLLDAQQVAARLNVPLSHIYEAARRGDLQGTKLGKKYVRFSEAAVRGFQAKQGS